MYMKICHCSVMQLNIIEYFTEWPNTHELTIDLEMHIVGVLPGWVCNGNFNIEETEADFQFVVTT